MIISHPVAPRNPPMTGKGTNRIARPACVNPRMQSTSPVNAVASDMTMSVGSRRSALPPWATMRWTTVATMAAMTTEIELSGPAMAKGSELRSATTRSADGSGQECHRYPISKQMRDRAGENERRVRQTIGNRQRAADHSGEHVGQSAAELLIVESADDAGRANSHR